MFRILSICAAFALLFSIGAAAPQHGGSSSASSSGGSSDAATHYYVSLGDSLAFGFQPNLFHSGDFSPADYRGYAEDYAASHPDLTLVNYGCPGETSASMLGNGRFGSGCFYPGALHNSFDGAKSQAAAATAFLAAHPGQVSLISVDIGSNDLLAVVDSCKGKAHPTACMTRALPSTLKTLEANYTTLLTELTKLAPEAQLVLFTYYNPMAIQLPGSDALVARASAVVRRLAGRFHASVADAFAAINRSAGSKAERTAVCKRTWICSKYHDVHPKSLGYRALALALEKALA